MHCFFVACTIAAARGLSMFTHMEAEWRNFFASKPVMETTSMSLVLGGGNK
jgi:hypothetical protein